MKPQWMILLFILMEEVNLLLGNRKGLPGNKDYAQETGSRLKTVFTRFQGGRSDTKEPRAASTSREKRHYVHPKIIDTLKLHRRIQGENLPPTSHRIVGNYIYSSHSPSKLRSAQSSKLYDPFDLARYRMTQGRPRIGLRQWRYGEEIFSCANRFYSSCYVEVPVSRFQTDNYRPPIYYQNNKRRYESNDPLYGAPYLQRRWQEDTRPIFLAQNFRDNTAQTNEVLSGGRNSGDKFNSNKKSLTIASMDPNKIASLYPTVPKSAIEVAQDAPPILGLSSTSEEANLENEYSKTLVAESDSQKTNLTSNISDNQRKDLINRSNTGQSMETHNENIPLIAQRISPKSNFYKTINATKMQKSPSSEAKEYFFTDSQQFSVKQNASTATTLHENNGFPTSLPTTKNNTILEKVTVRGIHNLDTAKTKKDGILPLSLSNRDVSIDGIDEVISEACDPPILKKKIEDTVRNLHEIDDCISSLLHRRYHLTHENSTGSVKSVISTNKNRTSNNDSTIKQGITSTGSHGKSITTSPGEEFKITLEKETHIFPMKSASRLYDDLKGEEVVSTIEDRSMTTAITPSTGADIERSYHFTDGQYIHQTLGNSDIPMQLSSIIDDVSTTTDITNINKSSSHIFVQGQYVTSRIGKQARTVEKENNVTPNVDKSKDTTHDFVSGQYVPLQDVRDPSSTTIQKLSGLDDVSTTHFVSSHEDDPTSPSSVSEPTSITGTIAERTSLLKSTVSANNEYFSKPSSKHNLYVTPLYKTELGMNKSNDTSNQKEELLKATKRDQGAGSTYDKNYEDTTIMSSGKNYILDSRMAELEDSPNTENIIPTNSNERTTVNLLEASLKDENVTLIGTNHATLPTEESDRTKEEVFRGSVGTTEENTSTFVEGNGDYKTINTQASGFSTEKSLEDYQTYASNANSENLFKDQDVKMRGSTGSEAITSEGSSVNGNDEQFVSGQNLKTTENYKTPEQSISENYNGTTEITTSDPSSPRKSSHSSLDTAMYNETGIINNTVTLLDKDDSTTETTDDEKKQIVSNFGSKPEEIVSEKVFYTTDRPLREEIVDVEELEATMNNDTGYIKSSELRDNAHSSAFLKGDKPSNNLPTHYKHFVSGQYIREMNKANYKKIPDNSGEFISGQYIKGYKTRRTYIPGHPHGKFIAKKKTEDHSFISGQYVPSGVKEENLKETQIRSKEEQVLMSSTISNHPNLSPSGFEKNTLESFANSTVPSKIGVKPVSDKRNVNVYPLSFGSDIKPLGTFSLHHDLKDRDMNTNSFIRKPRQLETPTADEHHAKGSGSAGRDPYPDVKELISDPSYTAYEDCPIRVLDLTKELFTIENLSGSHRPNQTDKGSIVEIHIPLRENKTKIDLYDILGGTFYFKDNRDKIPLSLIAKSDQNTDDFLFKVVNDSSVFREASLKNSSDLIFKNRTTEEIYHPNILKSRSESTSKQIEEHKRLALASEAKLSRTTRSIESFDLARTDSNRINDFRDSFLESNADKNFAQLVKDSFNRTAEDVKKKLSNITVPDIGALQTLQSKNEKLLEIFENFFRNESLGKKRALIRGSRYDKYQSNSSEDQRYDMERINSSELKTKQSRKDLLKSDNGPYSCDNHKCDDFIGRRVDILSQVVKGIRSLLLTADSLSNNQ